MGPTWEIVAMVLVSAVFALIGAYARGLSVRIKDVESKIGDINTAMLRDYHPKAEVREMLSEMRNAVQVFRQEMKENFSELKERFDHFEQIYGR